MSGAGLRIVCALPAEAKPLIERYRLQAHGSANPFECIEALKAPAGWSFVGWEK